MAIVAEQNTIGVYFLDNFEILIRLDLQDGSAIGANTDNMICAIVYIVAK